MKKLGTDKAAQVRGRDINVWLGKVRVRPTLFWFVKATRCESESQSPKKQEASNRSERPLVKKRWTLQRE